MSFYANHILPHVINLAMRNRELRPYRERVISAAEGRVLEIGIGFGLNLRFYRHAREVLGLGTFASSYRDGGRGGETVLGAGAVRQGIRRIDSR